MEYLIALLTLASVLLIGKAHFSSKAPTQWFIWLLSITVFFTTIIVTYTWTNVATLLISFLLWVYLFILNVFWHIMNE